REREKRSQKGGCYCAGEARYPANYTNKKLRSNPELLMNWISQLLGRDSCKLGDTARMVPVRNVNIGICVHIAAMRRAKCCCRDLVGIDLVICPLGFLRIVA